MEEKIKYSNTPTVTKAHPTLASAILEPCHRRVITNIFCPLSSHGKAAKNMEARRIASKPTVTALGPDSQFTVLGVY